MGRRMSTDVVMPVIERVGHLSKGEVLTSACEKVSSEFGLSRDTIRRIWVVAQARPDLIERIVQGKCSVASAYFAIQGQAEEFQGQEKELQNFDLSKEHNQQVLNAALMRLHESVSRIEGSVLSLPGKNLDRSLLVASEAEVKQMRISLEKSISTMRTVVRTFREKEGEE